MAEPVTYRFDGKNPEAQRVAKRQAAKMVTRVSDETRAAIRALIVRSIREGIPPYDAARMIRSMVGMTDRQAQAAMNYRESLVNSGLTLERVDKLTDRYVKKKIRERARNIARTELITSLNRGQQESWRQAKKEGLLPKDARKKVIVTPDERLCPICAPLADAEPVPINEPFQTSRGAFMTPGFHPSCRCAMGLVPPEEKTTPAPVTSGLHLAGQGKATPFGQRVREMVGKVGLVDDQHAIRVGKRIDDELRERAKKKLPKNIFKKEATLKKYMDGAAGDLQKLADQKVTLLKEIAKADARGDIARGDRLQRQLKKLDARSDKINASIQKWVADLDDIKRKIADTNGPDTLTEILSEIRDVGGVEQRWVDLPALVRRRVGISKTSKKAQRLVQKAMNLFPRDWLQKSNAWGPIHANFKGRRGFHTSFQDQGIITIKSEAAASRYYKKEFKGGRYVLTATSKKQLAQAQFHTALHESFHHMEEVLGDIVKLETEFYNRRTAGDSLKWLGPGYGRNERYRPDLWAEHYMGKDYKGRAYELGTMGVEELLGGRSEWTMDAEHRHFLLGLLAGIK